MLSDTKILPGEFEYFQPQTLADALALLAQWGPRAKVLAGGTDLIVKMKRLLVEPECLVSVQDLPELHGIRQEQLDGQPADETVAGGASPRRGGFETRPPD
ncbi:MAG: FAD binding domain-containing protein, partial [bacterium]